LLYVRKIERREENCERCILQLLYKIEARGKERNREKAREKTREQRRRKRCENEREGSFLLIQIWTAGTGPF
jgi:hypothetical protein